MNIGEEQEEQEYPEPVAPGKQNPIHEPSPQVAPVEEPAHASGWVALSEHRCSRS